MASAPFRLAMITGATSGIGEALARLIANKKVDLILVGRDLDRLKSLQNELSLLVKVKVLQADLLTADGRIQAAKTIAMLTPDLLINNAGFGLYGPMLKWKKQDILQVVELNNAAVVDLTYEAVKAFKKSAEKGVVLNVSSAAAFFTYPGFAVYSASKAFVNQFSLSLDYELEKEGIRILTACPGRVATGFSKRATSKFHSQMPQSMVMTSEYAAKRIWKQIVKRKRLEIFDWRYKLLAYLGKILPERFIASIQKKAILK